MGLTKVQNTIILVLFLLRFFGLKGMTSDFWDYIFVFILVTATLPVITYRCEYVKLILCYVFFVLLSCVYSWLFNFQSFNRVFFHSVDYFSLLFFFYLIRRNLTSNETLKVIKIISICFCAGYIIQWLAYPNIIFSGAMDDLNINEYQYRARMPGSICCYFMLLYAINRYLLVRDIKYVVYGILGFIPIIIQGFRSLVVMAVISSFLIIPFVLRSGKKVVFYSLLCISVFYAAFTTDLVQQKIEEMNKRQTDEQTFDNEDYIRWLSLDYYWNQQFTKPYEKFLGGGKPVDPQSKYTKNINIARMHFNFFWRDLGLIGLSMVIGVPAVILLVLMYIRCMWKCREPQIQFVRFTLLVVLVGSIFTSAELYRDGNILIFSLFAYLEYKYHQENNSKECLRRMIDSKFLIDNSRK